MKFAQFMTPSGHPVYVSPSFNIMSSIERPTGSLIKSQVGSQEVQQALPDVVKALEQIDG